MKFIKLTNAFNNEPIFIQIDKIVCFFWSNISSRIWLLGINNDTDTFVKETPEKILKLIKQEETK
jgi:hypothetical protein